MKYHAKLEYGGKRHYWWNHSKNSIAKFVIIPFLSGQIILIKNKNKKKLINLKNTTSLNIYRTQKSITVTIKNTVSAQINSQNFAKNDCTEDIIKELRKKSFPKESSSLIQKALSIPKNQVFVIMKFGDESLDSAYEGVYKPVVEQFKLECVRIDKIQDSGKISDQILEVIAQSKYIIADLSGGRPNCYYETGFAHAIGKELILCIRAKDKIHFDLGDYRFIVWKTELQLRKQLKERLSSLESKAEKSS